MADVLLSGTVTKKATGVLLISSDDVHNHAQKRDQILYFDAIHCVINEWRGTESENIFQVVCSINYLICKLITVHGFIKIISVNHFGYSIHKLIFFCRNSKLYNEMYFGRQIYCIQIYHNVSVEIQLPRNLMPTNNDE